MINVVLLGVTVIGSAIGGSPESRPASVLASHAFHLIGEASGGNLIMSCSMDRIPCWISIETRSGEPAAEVSERLARSINEVDPFGWGGFRTRRAYGRGEVIPAGDYLRVDHETVEGLPNTVGDYVFAGTESGLGIPSPPKSLSCAYSADKSSISLTWENPLEGYDFIRILVDGRGCGGLSGNETSYRMETALLARTRGVARGAFDDVDFRVIGIRGGLPSNAAAVTLKGDGQEELDGLPFTNNTATNWTTWTLGSIAPSLFEAMPRFSASLGRSPHPFQTSDEGRVTVYRAILGKAVRGNTDKPFIQAIRVASPNAIAGVYRKFLGLTPGHTYRLSARLFPLDMKKAEGDWSFSLHAIPVTQAASNLTAQQMAGQAALPDGKAGAEAGRIALYAPGVSPPVAPAEPTALPKRRAASAPADEPVANLVTGDITLPQGTDTIVVWLRHQAAHSTGVGMDWIRLEDVTGK